MSDVIVGADGIARCRWAAGDPLYAAYHDREWGRPVRDDRGLFERIALESFQSGLSWLTILRKRPAFRTAFADFAIARVAAFDDADIARLLGDAGIVRNHAKIAATIGNARAVQRMADADESLTDLLWSFAPAARPTPPLSLDDLPATTAESTAMAAALKQRGLRFVGPTTCYALMQAVGMVNDHLDGCDARDKVGTDTTV